MPTNEMPEAYRDVYYHTRRPDNTRAISAHAGRPPMIPLPKFADESRIYYGDVS